MSNIKKIDFKTVLPGFSDKCLKSPNNKFWYYLIPKNASMSFRDTDIFDNKHWHHPSLMPDDAVTILILRNPLDRFVSAYVWDKRNRRTELSIKEYLNGMKDGKYTHQNIPQIEYIKSRNINLDDVSHIFLVEFLNKQFNEFKGKYNLKMNLTFINESDKAKKEQALEILNCDENLELYTEIYKEDIELYNMYYEKFKN